MTPGEIRACYRLYAAHRKSREICTFAGTIPVINKPGDQTTSPVCCAYIPALKGWRATLATATPIARPSPGTSVTFAPRPNNWAAKDASTFRALVGR
jgi:hypothetical protein